MHNVNGPCNKFSIDPKKYNYLFGNVASNVHNKFRSRQLAIVMKVLGVKNNSKGHALLEEHFKKVVQNNDNVVKSFSNDYGVFEVRSSLFIGPSGKAIKFETTFQVLNDGVRKFNTLIPKGNSINY